jgi:SAM-dependent methyltransferase
MSSSEQDPTVSLEGQADPVVRDAALDPNATDYSPDLATANAAEEIQTDQLPTICDYEGSGYKIDFWEGQGRDYEDAVERIALRQLLPKHAHRYVEFGAGFGRLTDEGAAYEQVVLVDYSRSLLQEAQEKWGTSQRFVYVAADLNHLPFAPNAFDAAAMIRVLHHLPEPVRVLHQIRACLAPEAVFILEFANKLNLKAIARYLVGQQAWSPFDLDPVEFVRLNYDFHPTAVRQWLLDTGFLPVHTLAVSWLRAGLLKRRLPLQTLTAIDRVLQPLGPVLPLSPSVFVKNVAQAANRAPVVPFEQLFVNPDRPGSVLIQDGETMRCPETGARWAIHNGIYDFKAPIG